jgi:hypothetical protein
MRIYLDLDSRRLLTTPTRPLSLLEFKRRDNDSIELQFLRDAVVQQLPAGTTARVGIKPEGDYDAEFLAVSTLTQSGTGTSTVYSGALNLNTTTLATAFDSGPDKVSTMLEVEWLTGDVVSSSKTLPATIHNDVIRGNEGAPATLPLFYTSSTSNFLATQAEAEAGADNTKWMSPLRVAQAIEELGAGGGPHTHPLSDLTQSSATTGQVPTWSGTAWVPQTPSSGGGGGVTSYNDLTDVPSTFSPDTHTHVIADTTGLQDALDSKQVAGSYATAVQGALADTASQPGHTHATSDITSGTLALARIPTGTTSTTVALGNHTHTFGTTSGTFCQGDDSRLSDARTPTTHTHGNITNAGAIGTTSGVPIITGTSGVLQAGAFGTTAGTFCQGNDSRLLSISGGITAIAVVGTMPATPSATTLYIVTG